MAVIRHIHKAGTELTFEEREAARFRIQEATKYPIAYDRDCPELTDAQLAEFRPINGMTREERAQRMRKADLFAPKYAVEYDNADMEAVL
jgi:hypothetical protein